MTWPLVMGSMQQKIDLRQKKLNKVQYAINPFFIAKVIRSSILEDITYETIIEIFKVRNYNT